MDNCTHKCPQCRAYVSHAMEDCGAPYHVTCPTCRPVVDEAKLFAQWEVGIRLNETQYEETQADPLIHPWPDTSWDEWTAVQDIVPERCTIFRPYMERLTRSQARESSDETIRLLAANPTARFKDE